MTPKNEAPQPVKKRPYRAPTLAVHGDLKALAKGTVKAGTSSDGGKPGTQDGRATRVTGRGPPASLSALWADAVQPAGCLPVSRV